MLTVESLTVSIAGQSLISDINFTLAQGETLCIIGESGAGKSTLIKALQGLMPLHVGKIMHRPAIDQATTCYQSGDPWFGLQGTQWVMQNPLAALNPRQQVGRAILESIYHAKLSDKQRQTLLFEVLDDVQLTVDIATRYPQQLSIGQAQRVCIARALISRPALILFDEPLSALDAIVQKQVAATMFDIKNQHQLSYIVVTHDLGYASAYADNVLLLRNGIVKAYQSAADFFTAPQSDYAAALINAATVLGALPAMEKNTANTAQPIAEPQFRRSVHA